MLKLPLQITFKNLTRSPSLVNLIRRHARKLSGYSLRILGCRVHIESPHATPEARASAYNVRIDVTLAGEETVVHKTPWHNCADRNIYAGVRDAFRALERQVRAYEKTRKLRTP